MFANMLLPFYAAADTHGKIAICTVSGIKYISIEDAQSLPEGESEAAFPHCPLCVLSSSVVMGAPELKAEDALFYIPVKVTKQPIIIGAALQAQYKALPSAPRAPPTLL